MDGLNPETHTWGIDFAVRLLQDAGYEVDRRDWRIINGINGEAREVWKHKLYVRIPRNSAPAVPIEAENYRLQSIAIRHLLDRPPFLNGMRVRYPEIEFE